MPEFIEATFEIVTPMFLGGARSDELADTIRPPSVKGALRFWWRALKWGPIREGEDSDEAALRVLHEEEGEVFGIAADNEGGGGQGLFHLRVQNGKLRSVEKGRIHTGFKPTRRRNRHGRSEIDETHLWGARYLGYGLMAPFKSTNRETGQIKQAGQLDRGCFEERQEFTVKLLFKKDVEPSVQEALVAWGLMGGLGSRSRHGMGSVALKSLWIGEAEQWAPLTNADDYRNAIGRLFASPEGREATRALPQGKPPYTAFWAESRIDILLTKPDFYSVLDSFGNAVLMYRSWGLTKHGNMLPDGPAEKRFDLDHHWAKGDGIVPKDTWRSRNPNFHPKRLEFGLPHNYGQHDDLKVNAENYERRASPLFFHVHPVGKQFIGVSIYLPARFLPPGERINADGKFVPATITWTVIPGFLDGKVGNPPAPCAPDRFPAMQKVLP